MCDSIVRARCGSGAAEFPQRHAELVRFVEAQQARMPDFLRWALRVATLLFDVTGIAYTGSRFQAQSHAERWRQIEAWRNGPLSPTRDFIRFYESLVLYRWYAEDER